MMKQIRQRFIKIALLALTLAMLLVAGVINAVHYVNTSAELKETLNYIVENDNAAHSKADSQNGENLHGKTASDDSVPQTRQKGSNHHMNTKVEESRYFIAIQSADGELFLGAGSNSGYATTLMNRFKNRYGLYCPIYYMEVKASEGAIEQNPVWNKSKYEQ